MHRHFERADRHRDSAGAEDIAKPGNKVISPQWFGALRRGGLRVKSGYLGGKGAAEPGYFFPFALASLAVPCYLKQRSGTRYPPAKAGAAWVDPLEGAFPCEKLLRCRLGWELSRRWR